MTDRKVKFWDCSDDCETLSFEEFNEAIEYHLDDIPRDEWPETLKVFGFAPMEIKPESYSDWILESLVEHIDEEYGSPEENTEITEKMKEAALDFVNKVIANYQIWSCEVIETKEINIMEWVKENAPNWLEEPQTPELIK